MAEPHLPLFVYGTLRRGEENHHYLEGRYVRSIPAELHDYERVRPLLIRPEPGRRVQGELYFLKLDGYAETIANCDQLEELPPGQLIGHEYQRKVVTVQTPEGPFSAWAYVQPDPA